jgi:hypothetical protein
MPPLLTVAPPQNTKSFGYVPVFGKLLGGRTRAAGPTHRNAIEAGGKHWRAHGVWKSSNSGRQWQLAPRIRADNEQERQNAQQKVDALNPALDQAGVAGAQVLRDAPSGSMLTGSRIAKVFGFEVTFIEKTPDFDGVSLGGQGFISPSAKHPEIGLIGREVMHSLKSADRKAYNALAEQIRC